MRWHFEADRERPGRSETTLHAWLLVEGHKLRIGRAILSYLVHHEDFLKLILISWQQKSWHLDQERTRVDQYPAWILGI